MREDLLNSADIAILCLPDDASKDRPSRCSKPPTTMSGSSIRQQPIASMRRTGLTALPRWTQAQGGEDPRLPGYVANPGCYPTGAIGLVRPLQAWLAYPAGVLS